MKVHTSIVLIATHCAAALAGFVAGIYALPILIAPPAPTAAAVSATARNARWTGEFRRDLEDSDALHWGEGIVSVGSDFISLAGRLAPGPDYKLYLSPQWVETEADFVRLKPTMVCVGDVRTFENFVVPVPAGVDPSQFTTIVVWCESFSQFISSAKYR